MRNRKPWSQGLKALMCLTVLILLLGLADRIAPIDTQTPCKGCVPHLGR